MAVAQACRAWEPSRPPAQEAASAFLKRGECVDRWGPFPRVDSKSHSFLPQRVRRNPLRQFRRGDEPRGIFLQMAFATQYLKNERNGRKLPCDWNSSRDMVVQVTDEFPDHGMRDRMERGQSRPRGVRYARNWPRSVP